MWGTLYSYPIWMKPECSQEIFEKILQYQISWKSGQWEPSCPMQTDRRTYVTNLIVAFRNFTNAPKTVEPGYNDTG